MAENETTERNLISGPGDETRNRPSKVKFWIAEMRAPFLTAAIIPIILGTAAAWTLDGVFNWLWFILALIAGMSIHIGSNVANDYHDHKSGTDDINVDFVRPFTGGSRMIQEGLMTSREVLAEAILFYALGSILGIYLSIIRGWIVLLLGLVGLLSGYFYTAPPFRLVSRGIGEVFIGLNFGLLMTLGAYYIQTQQLALEIALLAIPVALLISAVLFINEFPDHDADKSAGKYTLVVRLGKQRASKAYALLMTSVYLTIIIPSILNLTSWHSLIAIASFPLAVVGVKTALLNYESSVGLIPAYASSVMNHLLTGLFLTTGYILEVMTSGIIYPLLISILFLILSILLSRKILTPPPIR
ncbi:1,4-dihydroxy-2-naphthoate octaprenyltransferase [Candidatus Thorarchaeota archaeon]|nr:MAG: 1,4-dihydroxy-2-naphthoate octaprenyltransferase [Candidatus Thorarchaeota archaeon]